MTGLDLADANDAPLLTLRAEDFGQILFEVRSEGNSERDFGQLVSAYSEMVAARDKAFRTGIGQGERQFATF